jgi:hypothetical protein
MKRLFGITCVLLSLIVGSVLAEEVATITPAKYATSLIK